MVNSPLTRPAIFCRGWHSGGSHDVFFSGKNTHRAPGFFLFVSRPLTLKTRLNWIPWCNPVCHFKCWLDINTKTTWYFHIYLTNSSSPVWQLSRNMPFSERVLVLAIWICFAKSCPSTSWESKGTPPPQCHPHLQEIAGPFIKELYSPCVPCHKAGY